MASMNGVNKDMGYNVAKPVVTKKGINPTQFARNNMSKGGVNKDLGGGAKKK